MYPKTRTDIMKNQNRIKVILALFDLNKYADDSADKALNDYAVNFPADYCAAFARYFPEYVK